MRFSPYDHHLSYISDWWFWSHGPQLISFIGINWIWFYCFFSFDFDFASIVRNSTCFHGAFLLAYCPSKHIMLIALEKKKHSAFFFFLFLLFKQIAEPKARIINMQIFHLPISSLFHSVNLIIAMASVIGDRQ